MNHRSCSCPTHTLRRRQGVITLENSYPSHNTAEHRTLDYTVQNISLNPGGADDFLVDGDQLQSAESAIILEEIVSKFLFSKVEESADP